MKKLIAAIAIMVAVLAFNGKEAKADYETLHGVADIIYAAGTVVNPGYDVVVYDSYPVYYQHHYYPRYNSYRYHHYYPRYRYYHCY